MAAHFKRHRFVLGLTLVGLVVAALAYLQSRGIMIDFEMVKMYRMDIELFIMERLFFGVLIFMFAYIATVGLSLPFATPLTVLSGFLFGTLLGTGIVAISATIGATIAFLLVRFFFRDYVTSKFGTKLRVVNDELRGNGFKDILILRLTPIVPFSLINVAAPLTSICVRDFSLATLFGTLPFTFVYVNAGTQIASVESVGDIVSFPTILGISLIVIAATVPPVIRRLRRPAVSRTQ
jgi:uncharacterized membrane protein YdjX (TVP38/TMEM64 family)